jgi:antitoxin component YwqK of YwqJK toxin-antitoxin module
VNRSAVNADSQSHGILGREGASRGCSGENRKFRVSLLVALLAAFTLPACDRGATRITKFADGHPWSETRYLEGEPEGLWTTWYKNGAKQSEGSYHRGYMQGTWKSWNEDGTLMLEATYARGKLDGPWRESWPNGRLKSRGTYKSGQPEGEWLEWYENGTKLREGSYVDGDQDGLWSGWDEDGKLKGSVLYKRGAIVTKAERGEQQGSETTAPPTSSEQK